MERRKAMILSICQADRRGGRVQSAGPHVLELYDCMDWDDDWSHQLRAHFPDTRVRYESSRKSLSGFVVRFHASAVRREWVWYAVIGGVLACCCYALHSYWSFLRGEDSRI